MSYLDTPRFHFTGAFYCNVSTVNNDPNHYLPKETDPSPWWNAMGDHAFSIQAARITGAFGPGGEVSGDPILQASFGTPERGQEGRLVDLDTDQQGVSMIFGLQPGLLFRGGGEVRGQLVPCALNGLWQSVMPTMAWGGGGGDTAFSAAYQSVIRVPASGWTAPEASQFLAELRKACATDADGNLLLSVGFTLDAFCNDSNNSKFLTGRIRGTVGPQRAGEPLHTLGARWLEPRPLPKGAAWNYLAFNGGAFLLDEERKKLVFDLGNSLPVITVGGSMAGMGQLNAVCTPAGGAAQVLGPVDYNFSQAAYAGVAEIDLTTEQVQLVRSAPVSLVANSMELGPPEILGEQATGLAFAVDERVFRMAPDTSNEAGAPFGTAKTATTEVRVTRWGRPAVGEELVLGLMPSIPPNSPGNSDPKKTILPPNAAQAFRFSATPSDAKGVVSVTMDAIGDPGSRSTELDGQMFMLGVAHGSAPSGGKPILHGEPLSMDFSETPQQRQISVHMYSAYAVIEKPDWTRDIQPLFVPYMKLYPFMKDKIDLTVENTFLFWATTPPPCMETDKDGKQHIKWNSPIPVMMTVDFMDSSDYMPLTRDLSPNRIQTVFHFITNMVKSAGAIPACPPAKKGGDLS